MKKAHISFNRIRLCYLFLITWCSSIYAFPLVANSSISAAVNTITDHNIILGANSFNIHSTVVSPPWVIALESQKYLLPEIVPYEIDLLDNIPNAYQLYEGKSTLLENNNLPFVLSDYVSSSSVIIPPIATLMMPCCANNLLVNPSFENNTPTLNQQFPNVALSPVPNAQTTTVVDEWNYDDGPHVNDPFPIINDPSRASHGDYFVYIPDLGPTGGFNRCVGDLLLNSGVPGTCPSADGFTAGLRYVLSFEYVIFNPDSPTGGAAAGNGLPAMEYLQNGSVIPLDMYDENATAITAFEDAVHWNDVGTSWQTAYGLTPALPSSASIKVFYSNDVNATAGMLVDNAYFAPLQINQANLSNIECGANPDEITFILDPSSNFPGDGTTTYDVDVPSGFSISPSTGIYGEQTTFTLTIDSGDFSSGAPASIDIDLEDSVNNNCTVVASVGNPFPSCGCLPSASCGQVTVVKN